VWIPQRKVQIMAFCNLPASQAAALLFMLTMEYSAKAPPQMKALIAQKDWKTLSLLASMTAPAGTTTPSIDDFTTVGNMSQGLQNAYFVLLMADTQGTPDGKAQLQSALDTHCWDQTAAALVSSMSATGITFTGADLHQAYAPNDNSPCSGPSGFEIALGKVVAAGLVVGDFFSHSLPDFFTNDVSNFFTGTLANFFTGDFANFFTSIGNSIADGFKTMASTLQSAFGHLDPTHW
jgi:hypothetical protein